MVRHGSSVAVYALEPPDGCLTAVIATGALLTLASGSLIGLVLGLVGGGGSILAVPLLVYVLALTRRMLQLARPQSQSRSTRRRALWAMLRLALSNGLAQWFLRWSALSARCWVPNSAS
jgi:hypothetical protein